MRLRALKNIWVMDRKKGTYCPLKIGQEFELDETVKEEGADIYSLLGANQVSITDEKFVPSSWRYVALQEFEYKSEAGFSRVSKIGQELTLSQEIASGLLAKGHIKPVDEGAWIPRKLLAPALQDDKVKQMFDDPVSEKENWVMKGRQ